MMNDKSELPKVKVLACDKKADLEVAIKHNKQKGYIPHNGITRRAINHPDTNVYQIQFVQCMLLAFPPL